MPLPLSFSHSPAKLVTSSHLPPDRGAFLWSLPFSSRLARLTSHLRPELPFLLFLFPRANSLSLPSTSILSSLSNLAPVLSFVVLHLAPFCRRRSLFPFAERDSAAAALPELVHRKDASGRQVESKKTATLISLCLRAFRISTPLVPSTRSSFSSPLANRIERRTIKPHGLFTRCVEISVLGTCLFNFRRTVLGHTS